MFNYLQSRIRGTAVTGPGQPPPGLLAFYWHFVRQTKGWYGAMFATSLAVALIDTVIPVFIGKLVALMQATDRQAALAHETPLLIGMVVLILLVRPLVRLMEQAVIDLLADHGVNAVFRADAPGVYVDQAKIAALGLRIRNGRCYHGLALNVDMDLKPFNAIDPCGYPGLAVTQTRSLGIGGSPREMGDALAVRIAALLEPSHG